MLWYKAWLETRVRFLISLVGILALCSYHVYHGIREGLPQTGPDYYNMVLHTGHLMLSTMWTLAVTLLAMGGLLREKAVGTAGFSLALPVSRARLMRARISVALAQAVALAAVPWCAMFLIAVTMQKAHSLSQAWFHLALLLGGGIVLFGIALLVSSVVEGEYTAPAVSLGVLLAIGFVFSEPSFRDLYPLAPIGGGRMLNRSTWLLVGSIPWGRIAASVTVGALLIAASVKAVERREF